MSTNLFETLRQKNAAQQGAPEPTRGPYTFSGGSVGDSPFRRQPGSTSTTPNATVRPPTPAQYPPPPPRGRDFDRPAAYAPPAARESGVIREYAPPQFGEILRDLGLRLLEVGIAAVAQALGNEIAYYFQQRRLYTKEQQERYRQ